MQSQNATQSIEVSKSCHAEQHCRNVQEPSSQTLSQDGEALERIQTYLRHMDSVYF